MSGWQPTTSESVRDRVLACSGEKEIADGLLRPVAHMVHAESATILDFKRGGSGEIALERSWSHRLSQHCQDEYSNRYFLSDPMVRSHMRGALMAPDRGKTATVFGVTDVGALCAEHASAAADDYYRAFWQANGFEHLLVFAFWLPALPDHGLIAAFHRPQGTRPFGKDSIAKARSIAPAVGSVLGNVLLANELERANTVRDALALCLEDFGFSVLDEHQRVIFANETAERHWVGAVSNPSLRQYITNRRSSAHAPQQRFGQIKILAERSVGPRDRMVLTSAITDSTGVSIRCKSYGLTMREIEVASLLCDGLSNPEIAGVLELSVRTVENHLRTIFRKTCVESRTRLIRKLLAA